MKVHLVRWSTGQYDDTMEHNDSVWSKKEDALKRCEILKKIDAEECHKRSVCYGCPIHTDSDCTLEQAMEYCKQYGHGKGNIKLIEEYDALECEESSVNYEEVTVYSPEAIDLDNTELLRDGKANSCSD